MSKLAVMAGWRRCITCGAEKPPSEFYGYPYTTNQGKRSYRLDSRCKPCGRERRRKRYRENPERDLAASRAWKVRHRDDQVEYTRQYRRAKPEVKRLSEAKRRKAGAKHVTADWILELKRWQRNKCAECRRRLAKYHIDHIMPLSLGGIHEKANLQLLCPSCNRAKSAHHPIDWAQQQGRLL